ncbi:hypothetical protein [Kitasatospora sp. GP82]|uniref:hypothetical protein n=1 Tax=Kitasatospora sp. GP82 TaxID=3035089 RepID=UPI002475A8D4|nr:hypothetical protein [Kitasatospora sp. GP82]MDH6126684.1 hypothetical protein [Kitasatospora sp. GP82]
MSSGFRVDTSELEAVVRRLRALQQNLGQTANKSKYNTVISRNDLGGDFAEAQTLHSAHDGMQQFLAGMISDLDSLINDFGDKTKAVNDAYRNDDEAQSAKMKQQEGSV